MRSDRPLCLFGCGVRECVCVGEGEGACVRACVSVTVCSITCIRADWFWALTGKLR